MYTYTGDTRRDTGKNHLYDKHFYLRQPGRSEEFVRELGDVVERRSRETIVNSSSSSSSPHDCHLGRSSHQLVQRAFEPLTIDFTASAPAVQRLFAGYVSLSINRAVFCPNLLTGCFVCKDVRVFSVVDGCI